MLENKKNIYKTIYYGFTGLSMALILAGILFEPVFTIFGFGILYLFWVIFFSRLAYIGYKKNECFNARAFGPTGIIGIYMPNFNNIVTGDFAARSARYYVYTVIVSTIAIVFILLFLRLFGIIKLF
jgi:hypothetical protein